jgi:hypothetical protein
MACRPAGKDGRMNKATRPNRRGFADYLAEVEDHLAGLFGSPRQMDDYFDRHHWCDDDLMDSATWGFNKNIDPKEIATEWYSANSWAGSRLKTVSKRMTGWIAEKPKVPSRPTDPILAARYDRKSAWQNAKLLPV